MWWTEERQGERERAKLGSSFFLFSPSSSLSGLRNACSKRSIRRRREGGNDLHNAGLIAIRDVVTEMEEKGGVGRGGGREGIKGERRRRRN